MPTSSFLSIVPSNPALGFLPPPPTSIFLLTAAKPEIAAGAEPEVMSAVECKHPGYFTKDIKDDPDGDSVRGSAALGERQTRFRRVDQSFECTTSQISSSSHTTLLGCIVCTPGLIDAIENGHFEVFLSPLFMCSPERPLSSEMLKK